MKYNHKKGAPRCGLIRGDGQADVAGLASNYVYSIAIDAAGNKWFGTDNGVSKFDGTTWTTYTTADGLADNYVEAILIDAAGNKWFGTLGGVSKFDGITWTTYTTANGLVGNLVRSIAIDTFGNKWFGTWGGVSKFNGATWTTYTAANGLASFRVCSIAIDATGNKWFGTGGGVSELFTIPGLTLDYSSGAPGSFFNVSGDGFPPNQTASVTVNGASMGSLPTTASGTFTFTLTTARADEGFYDVTVSVNPSATVKFTLDASEPVRPQEGNYTTFDVSPGVAYTHEVYLPLVKR